MNGIINGRLEQAEWVPSPNFGLRPSNIDISLIVVHNISLPPGKFGGGYIESFFQNGLCPDDDPYFESIASLQVSSHLLIDRHGAITQFVNFNDRAWHAGVSSYGGRSDCNDFSIGIELEGTDTLPYTPSQYDSLAMVVQALRVAYPSIGDTALTGHEHIAPGRKTDPGPAFDWELLLALLADG